MRADLHGGRRAVKNAHAATAKAQTQSQAQAQAQLGGPDVALAPADGQGGGTTTSIAVEAPLSERALKLRRRKVERMLAEHKLDEEQI